MSATKILALHLQTHMMSYGYDPALSEGAVKPPVFLTSTFAFKTAEEGAAYFDIVGGRAPAPSGKANRRSRLFSVQPSEC
jgi:methionine-gamma-lyase